MLDITTLPSFYARSNAYFSAFWPPSAVASEPTTEGNEARSSTTKGTSSKRFDERVACGIGKCKVSFQALNSIKYYILELYSRYHKYFIQKTFILREALEEHKLSHRQFECDLCGKEFGKKFNLRIHKENVHEKKSVTCEICNLEALVYFWLQIYRTNKPAFIKIVYSDHFFQHFFFFVIS